MTRGVFPVAVIVSLLIATTAPSMLPAAEPSPGAASEDWPGVIARIKEALWRSSNQSDLRLQLAIAYNNYAVSLGDQGKWELAANQLEEAVKLSPDRPDFKTNLARIYLQQAVALRGTAGGMQPTLQTTRVAALVRKAIALDKNLADAYALLGQIEYESQHLKEATAAWERAKRLNPNLPGITEALDRLKTEASVESDFDRLSQMHFDIRYEEDVSRSVGFDVQGMLLQARRSVGTDFRYWPGAKMVVLLYSAKTFRAMRKDTPEWVGGQFDGKIRLPLPEGDLDEETVRQILHHEYTHALVRDLSRNRCPTWFNEGLAEYQGARAGKRHTEFLGQAFERGQLIPWSELDGGFSSSLTAAQVGLAYQESHSIVEFLAQRYGFNRLRKLLAAIGDGANLEEAMAKEFHTPVARLEKNWREWLPGFVR